MSYLYKNEFEEVYQADVGNISKIKDSESKYNNKLIYKAGRTLNGHCYKNYNIFETKPDEICYIAECVFDKNNMFVDYINGNKEKLIKKGGVSTANSIKEEIRNTLKYDEYYYEYQKDGIVHTIQSKDFDDKLINIIASEVFDVVDWETTQAYIYETDWSEDINEYYRNKFNKESGKVENYEL